MFRLLTRLMAAESSKKIGADLDYFCCLIGRYFQIRDDYQNLVSLDVSIDIAPVLEGPRNADAGLLSSTRHKKGSVRTWMKASTRCL